MIPSVEPIYVSRPLLPPLDELTARLEEVWASRWLTNGGAQHERLEEALRLYLGAPHLSLFNNGTIALLTAVRALGCTGSVVTTPFTFPATPHVLAWSGIEPVFCDIDPVSLTIDPEGAEAAIRGDTTAILGVHVYGVPCDGVRLQALASRRALRLLYDGAHAFGTTIAGAGIASLGDATMFSFHATKLFHTAEGGALTTRDAPLKAAFDHLKNFGICNQEEVDVPGINGKLNELQAALGLAVLEHVAHEVERRRAIVARYRAHLGGVEGLTLMPEPPGVVTSCQYFVIRIEERSFGASRDAVQANLRQHNVLTRKYFYPLCSDYPCYNHLPSAHPSNLPVARRVAEEVLCLPIYGDLPLDAVDRICEMLLALRATAVPRTGGAA
jgi:dTDP-4-amino-4,6-dideoxygalactose transaminase